MPASSRPARPYASLFRLLLAFLFLACFQPAFAAPDTDAQLRARIVGRWQELRTFDCESHQHFIQIRPNGTLEVQGVVRTCEGTRTFIWRASWKVKDGKFQYKTTGSIPAGEYQLGQEFEDEIVSISADEWLMREQSTGGESRAYRIK